MGGRARDARRRRAGPRRRGCAPAPLGFVEVESDHTSGGTLSRLAGWADVGNLLVEEPYRRRGVATWLLGQAAAWLRLGGVARLLSYTTPDEEESLAFHAHAGFRELARTRRGWTRSTMGA